MQSDSFESVKTPPFTHDVLFLTLCIAVVVVAVVVVVVCFCFCGITFNVIKEKKINYTTQYVSEINKKEK